MSGMLHGKRRGAALVVALVALAIVGGVAASMLRAAVLSREHLQMAQRRRQADWLLASGFQRAQGLLAADRDYLGETWRPEWATPAAGTSADVTIRVDEQPEHQNMRRIHVVVRYQTPGGLVQRTGERMIAAAATEK